MGKSTLKAQRVLFFCFVLVLPAISLVYRLCDLKNYFGVLKSANSAVLSLFFNFFMFTILLIILKMLSQIWQETHDKYEMQLSEQTRDMLKRQEQNVSEFRVEINKRHRMIYETLDRVKDYGKQGDFIRMKEMISDLSVQMEKNKVESFCPNALLNTILQVKKSEVEKKNIQCHFQIILPDKFETFFPDTVITSLFCNLLDNAIESCENVRQQEICQQPLIILSVNYQANMLIISQKNSKNPEIIFNHETSKEQQQELHGLGLYMIEDIVKEYDGVVEWKDAGEMFESNLMLKLR